VKNNIFERLKIVTINAYAKTYMLSQSNIINKSKRYMRGFGVEYSKDKEQRVGKKSVIMV
jgi:hypothetical protein